MTWAIAAAGAFVGIGLVYGGYLVASGLVYLADHLPKRVAIRLREIQTPWEEEQP